MASQRFTLNLADVKRIFKNAVIFLAPVLITELTLLQQGVTEPREYFIAFQVWIIGVAIDTLRKWQAGK